VTQLVARCWSILLGFFEQLIDLNVVGVMRINNLPHEWLDDRLAPPCDSGSLNVTHSGLLGCRSLVIVKPISTNCLIRAYYNRINIENI
jgi:hypothetical protein